MTTNRSGAIPAHRVPRLRPIAILASAVAIAAATYVAGAFSGPVRPLDGSSGAAPAAVPVPAAQAPLGGDGTAIAGTDVGRLTDQIAVWGAKADADPNDYLSATSLGILFLGRARLTDDAADYERAAAAAERAIAADPAYAPARTLRAVLLHATHDFAGALAAAEALVAEDPRNVDALAVAADAKLELGRLEEAGADYARLASLAPGPALDLRLARWALLRGEPARAMTLVERARTTALADGTAHRALYEGQAGEIARLTGDAARARRGFEAALAARPTDRLALLGLARVEAFEGDVAAAVDLLDRAAAIVPQPETLALLGDLRAAAGDARGAEEAWATVRLIGRVGGAAATLFERPLLQFELDHGGASAALLERARAAAEARPDAAGLDLQAWAAFRLGDLEAARAASARALATGTVDARILFHAGAIELAAGDRATGRAQIRAALALGPALDPAERAEAAALLAP